MFCFFIFITNIKVATYLLKKRGDLSSGCYLLQNFLKNSIYLVDIFYYECYNNITKKFPDVTKEKKK